MDNDDRLKAAIADLKRYEVMIDQRLPKAEAGNRESALNLLSVAACILNYGYPMPPKLADWLALGLHGISAGLTAEESFGIARRKKGERSTETKIRISNERFRRAFLVEYLHRFEKKTIADACAAVAEAECVDTETVNHAWDENREQAKFVLAVSWGEVFRTRESK